MVVSGPVQAEKQWSIVRVLKSPGSARPAVAQKREQRCEPIVQITQTTAEGEAIMSGKSGKRETANKPTTTRRHDSQASGAFGQEASPTRSETQTNLKRSGEPSHQHSKYKRKAGGK